MALIFLLLPPLLSSLVDAEYESACPRRKVEALVFDLVRLAEASASALLLWPPSWCLLGLDRGALPCRCGEAEVVAFVLSRLAEASSAFWSHWPPSLCLLAIE